MFDTTANPGEDNQLSGQVPAVPQEPEGQHSEGPQPNVTPEVPPMPPETPAPATEAKREQESGWVGKHTV